MFRIQDSLLDNVLHFCSQEKHCVFLDTSLPNSENNVSLLFVKPRERLVYREGDDLSLYLEKLENELAAGNYLAGWIGYEFGSMFEQRCLKKTTSFSKPSAILADFGVFLKPYKFDHHTGEYTFPIHSVPSVSEAFPAFSVVELKPNMDEDEFVQNLKKIQKLIAAGDTYQVNYTMKLLFDFEGSVESLYRSLRRNQSVSYGAYIKTGDTSILSFSPELFFRKSDDKIIVRPMKGTAIRGNNLDEEVEHIETLHNDPKNRAENVMIVDLLRNDLSRLLQGEEDAIVKTQSLFDVESYESLLQMTSTVVGSALTGVSSLSLWRLFHSLFPCGSITGAPKIRTMEIIEDLEKEPRGVYTGAIGYLAPDGNATFNVPIRTVCLHGKKGEMGIGAGITHDSVPIEEWHESLLKGKFLTQSQDVFQLFETILWQKSNGFYLLEPHLARLRQGSEYYKFALYEDELQKKLQGSVESFLYDCMRIRLVLHKDGDISVNAIQCNVPGYTDLPQPAEVERRPVAGTVRFAQYNDDVGSYIYHKTTNRSHYDVEFERVNARGDLDALFYNSKGEMTEGCISNIVILKNGAYITPPISCGLLAGIMRGQLLDSANASPVVVHEAIITRVDVQRADAVFICNSIRGVVRVEVAPSSAH